MTVASQVKQTLASLKGTQGTLRLYSAQSRDAETKSVYKEAINVTSEVINDLENRLQMLELQEPQYKGK
jgi:hypothetical protein